MALIIKELLKMYLSSTRKSYFLKKMPHFPVPLQKHNLDTFNKSSSFGRSGHSRPICLCLFLRAIII